MYHNDIVIYFRSFEDMFPVKIFKIEFLSYKIHHEFVWTV